MFVGAGKITSSCNYLFHGMTHVFELSIVNRRNIGRKM